MSHYSTLPSVSVVVPSYNYANYLGTAIRSVLLQNHSALEVLVVDDGSTDGTAALVSTFDDVRVRYLYQKNAGLSAARNKGIQESRFSFIAFLDADDSWEPEFLTTVLQEFERLGPSYGAVGTAVKRIDCQGNPLPPPRRIFLKTGELTTTSFCLRNRPLSSSTVLRRQVFDDCEGFDPTLRSSEDRDMWIRLTARGHRFYFLDQPLGSIRRHAQNMSKNAPRMKENAGVVLSRAWRHGVIKRANLPVWLRVVSVHYFVVSRTHFDDGWRAKAWLYLLISIVAWPVFIRPHRIAEPPFFRLRSMAFFLRHSIP